MTGWVDILNKQCPRLWRYCLNQLHFFRSSIWQLHRHYTELQKKKRTRALGHLPETTFQSWNMNNTQSLFLGSSQAASAPLASSSSSSSFSSPPPPASDVRLPYTASVDLYNISLRPYLEESDGEKRFTFQGFLEANVQVNSSTDKIIFNAKNLNIT